MATSKKRESVFISIPQRDREVARRAAADARKGGGSSSRSRPASEARALAEARRADRERRMSDRRRSAQIRIAAVVAAVVLLAGACVWVYGSDLFKITSIEVDPTAHLTRERVLELAQVPQSATLLRFPADEVAARVSADPWVAAVSVSRVFPSGMRIKVTERVPIAVVDAGASFMLIDSEGMVLTTATADATASIPVIRKVPGLDLKPGRRTVSEPLINALAVLAGISRELAAMVIAVDAVSVDETMLVTSDRVEIVIGQADDPENPLATKDGLARGILQEQKGKVVGIDVRLVDRPTSHGLAK